MYFFFNRCPTFSADAPVSCFVFSPRAKDGFSRMLTLFMITFLKALIINITPVRSKFIRVNAKLMLAAYILCIIRAAINAKTTVFAEFIVLITVAALLADMVVIIKILGADSVLAMIPAILAHMAVFTEIIKVEALTAVYAKMVFPLVKVFRADLVLAMIISLAVFTETAVFTLIVIRTLHAVRAEMVLIIRREDTVTMGTALSLAVVKATVYAETAVLTLLNAYSFGTLTALLTDPAVVVTALYTVVAAGLAHSHSFFSEAVTTLAAVLFPFRTVFAHATLTTHLNFTAITAAAMYAILTCMFRKAVIAY